MKVKFRTAGLAIKMPVDGIFMKWAILTSIFILALATRIYRLDEIPYFPTSFPWVGKGSEGLYWDEYNYLEAARQLFNPLFLYQPPLFLLFINISVNVVGASFAARIPSAIASSLTAVLICLITRKKFGSWSAAIMSSLYFIVMTPAFIYNRMAFLENGVALFLVSSFYCLLLYDESDCNKWLYVSAIFAVLSTLCKINGILAPMFFLIYSLYKGFYRKALKSISIIFASLIFPLAVLVAEGSWDIWRVGYVGKEGSIFQFLILNTMPSGYSTQFLGFLRPEYWYIFAYFALGYIAIKEYEKVADIVLMTLSFIALCTIALGIGSYYLIILQPFFAIPIGYALKRMLVMKPSMTAFFILFIYAPMAITFSISSFGQGSYPSYDYLVYALKILTVGVPLASSAWFFIKGDKAPKTWRLLFNMTILALFLVLLFIGSYLVPAFYPHYFNT